MTFNTGHFNRIRFNRSEVVPEEIAEASVAMRTLMTDTTNWLEGWSHRKSHTITASGSNLTGEVIRLTIHRTSGTDTDDDVYLGTGCEDDYADIRFTTDDGKTLLSYAFPPDLTPDSSSAVVDILVPTISTSGTTIYVYYGNASATDASAPETVYLLYDPFPGSSVDGSKWTVTGSQASVSGGVLTVLGDDDIAGTYLKSVADIGQDVLITVRMKSAHFTIIGDPDTNEMFGLWNSDPFMFAHFYGKYVTGQGTGMCVANKWGASVSYNTITNWTADTYKTLQLWRKSTGSADWFVDDTPITPLTTAYQTFNGKVYIWAQGMDTRLDLECVYIKTHASVQPTHGSWGTEEDVPITELNYVTWYPVAAEATIEMTPETVGVVISFTAAEASIDITPETWPAQVFQDIHSMRDLHQVAFVSGKHAPDLGGIVVGATSGTRAEIVAITLSTGTWGVDAAGMLYIRILSGAGFIPGEKLNEV